MRISESFVLVSCLLAANARLAGQAAAEYGTAAAASTTGAAAGSKGVGKSIGGCSRASARSSTQPQPTRAATQQPKRPQSASHLRSRKDAGQDGCSEAGSSSPRQAHLRFESGCPVRTF